MRTQTSLFETSKQFEGAKVEFELPNLTGEKQLALDTETTGLKLWRGDKPVGLSVATVDGNGWYIPWGHKEGFNFEFENVKKWVEDNLRDKEIFLTNAKFDFNMLLNVGIDLEELNVKPREVMHLPALLYSTRKDYNLDAMALEFLGRHKVDIGDKRKFPIHERSSESVACYAIYDSVLTIDLHKALTPRIEQEDLVQVRDLEDDIIYPVARMEREGCPVDLDKLYAWQKTIQARYIKSVMRIYELTGLRIEPTKKKDLAKLFTALKIKSNYITPKGDHSYSDEALQEFAHLEPVRLAIEAKDFASFRSKFIDPFIDSAKGDGKLRYVLNQLKASNEEGSKGTVTGRFSSSGGGSEINGVNIQQVYDDAEQRKIEYLADFVVRDICIPEAGKLWLSADARQIEFRIIAHYTNSNRLINAYKNNPLVDFHTFVAEEILHVPRDKKLKNMNFGKAYGMGVNKLAEVYLKMPLEQVIPLNDHYDREFPEMKGLLKQAMGIAERRGYVMTFLKRRRRFTKEDMRFSIREGKKVMPYWSALPAIISGTAADIMKIKIRDLHRDRKDTQYKMRFTVHDEVDGDIPDVEHARKVKEILNEQSLPLRVPILWKVELGSSWGNLSDELK